MKKHFHSLVTKTRLTKYSQRQMDDITFQLITFCKIILYILIEPTTDVRRKHNTFTIKLSE